MVNYKKVFTFLSVFFTFVLGICLLSIFNIIEFSFEMGTYLPKDLTNILVVMFFLGTIVNGTLIILMGLLAGLLAIFGTFSNKPTCSALAGTICLIQSIFGGASFFVLICPYLFFGYLPMLTFLGIWGGPVAFSHYLAYGGVLIAVSMIGIISFFVAIHALGTKHKAINAQ